MKKVWSSLIILAILVGMFVCMGAQAFATEGGAEIFAVAGQQPGFENVAEMQSQSANGIVLGVQGLDSGLGMSGYTTVAYAESDPMMTTGLTYVWPGHAVAYYYDNQKLAIVGVSGASTAEEIAGALAALGDYTAEDYYVVTVGPKEAASVIGQSADADMFVTTGIDEMNEGASYAEAVGAAKLVNVASDETNPVSMIDVSNNAASVSAIPMPAPAAEPDDGQEGEGEPADGADSGIGDMLAPGLPIVDNEGEGQDEPQESEGEPAISDMMAGPGIVELPNVCTVNFDGNGATGGSMDPVAVTDGSFEFPACGFTREGYTFQSWVTPDWIDHQPGETITITEGMTISASWTENAATYNVVYACAEEHTGVVADAMGLAAGSTHVLEANGYAREGYDFAGWDVNGTVMHPGDSITVDQNITVLATWTEISQEGGGDDPNEQPTAKSAVVTFDPNGGALVEGESNTQTVEDIGEGMEYGVPDGATMLTPPAEGKTFAGWRAPNDEHVYKAGEQYFLTGDVTLTAQWTDTSGTEPGPVVPAPETYSVTYKNGDTVVTEQTRYPEGTEIIMKNFEALGFSAPEGKKFKSWTIDGMEYAPGAVYKILASDVVIEAVFEDLPPENFVVHFNANGGSGTMADVTVGANSEYVIPGTGFTAPQGKVFIGWLIGETIYKSGDKYTVSAETTLTAQWDDLKSAGHVDALTWTAGGNDLSVTYQAPIATVKIDNALLTSGVHYQLSADGKTATIASSYLGTLAAGNHTIEFSFSDTQGDIALAAVYANETVNLYIPPADTSSPAPTNSPAANTKEVTWADRSQNLQVTFEAAPQKLYIDYGGNGLKEAAYGADYEISGNTLILKPDLVNKNWGGAWPNARYGFKVSMADGTTTYTLKITLSGNIPATATATPTPKGGTSPVTGDTNNIVLYVVLLAVLVLALAVVLIVMVKRRNNGRR